MRDSVFIQGMLHSKCYSGDKAWWIHDLCEKNVWWFDK